jgi:hypothetical protein
VAEPDLDARIGGQLQPECRDGQRLLVEAVERVQPAIRLSVDSPRSSRQVSPPLYAKIAARISADEVLQPARLRSSRR